MRAERSEGLGGDPFQGQPRKKLPFRLLMLGGDDILLVCDAIYAMPLVVNIARNLEAHQLADDKHLHLGIGVAVVKKKFPFHRSHALAEQLVASAKRLYRSLPDAQKGSTVDWLATSGAWHDDVVDVRQRDAVKRFEGQTLLLTRRPYRVLMPATAGTAPADTLEALWNRAEAAAKQGERGRLGGVEADQDGRMPSALGRRAAVVAHEAEDGRPDA